MGHKRPSLLLRRRPWSGHFTGSAPGLAPPQGFSNERARGLYALRGQDKVGRHVVTAAASRQITQSPWRGRARELGLIKLVSGCRCYLPGMRV